MEDDLFSYPHARRDDPDTSHDAVPKNLTDQAKRVLHAYRDGKVLLDERAYERVGLDGHQRCSDLRAAGLIEDTGARATTAKKKSGMLCRITQKGRDYLDGISPLFPSLVGGDGAEVEPEDDDWDDEEIEF